jgi:hypothetical protein
MKTHSLRSALVLLVSLSINVAALAADQKKPVAPAASAAAIAAYPLSTCVVSGDKLDEANDMGGPVDYFYKVAGQPDRLVRFCCKDCVKDFEKDPAKFLAKIDEAAAAKAKSAAKK